MLKLSLKALPPLEQCPCLPGCAVNVHGPEICSFVVPDRAQLQTALQLAMDAWVLIMLLCVTLPRSVVSLLHILHVQHSRLSCLKACLGTAESLVCLLRRGLRPVALPPVAPLRQWVHDEDANIGGAWVRPCLASVSYDWC